MMERKRLYHLPREDSNTSNSTSNFFALSEERKPVRKLVTPSSSLEIVEGDQFAGATGTDRSPSETSFRSWSRSSIGSVPPRSDSSLSRRTLTPTKQISLQAVRRREESSEPFVDHIDVESARLESNNRKVCWDFSNQDDDIDFSRLSVGDHRRSHGNNNSVNGGNAHAMSMSNGESSKVKSVDSGGNDETVAPNYKTKDNKDSSSDDDGDDDEDDDDDDDEKRKAPNELLMEFVDCLMKKDFSNASKLCKMILLYEPENEEALKFQPLIEEKMRLDAEAAAAEEEEGSSDEEDDDDDDDDDDSDEDSSSDDDDDESEDDDDNDVGDNNVPQVPSDNKVIGANTSRVWKPAS